MDVDGVSAEFPLSDPEQAATDAAAAPELAWLTAELQAGTSQPGIEAGSFDHEEAELPASLGVEIETTEAPAETLSLPSASAHPNESSAAAEPAEPTDLSTEPATEAKPAASLDVEPEAPEWPAPESSASTEARESAGPPAAASVFSSASRVADAYALLGLTAAATTKQLRRTYHREALQHHPDKQVCPCSRATAGLPSRRADAAICVHCHRAVEPRPIRRLSSVSATRTISS